MTAVYQYDTGLVHGLLLIRRSAEAQLEVVHNPVSIQANLTACP